MNLQPLRSIILAAGFLFMEIAATDIAEADVRIRTTMSVNTHVLNGLKINGDSTVSVVWYSATNYRADQPNRKSFIYDLKTNQHCTLYHDRKIATPNMYNDVPVPDSTGETRAPRPSLPMDQFRPLSKPVLEITDDWKVLLGYKCRRHVLSYKLPQGTYKIEMWVAEIPGIERELQLQMGNPSQNGDPKFRELLDVCRQIKGISLYTVKTLSTEPEAKAIDEVTEIKTVQTPPGFYDIPEGYQIIEN